MERGFFITFEGPEGSGKSTQLKRLIQRLEQGGNQVLSVREPGGTPTGEAIRGILQYDKAGEPLAPAAELLLFAASRAQLVERVIRPALADGVWVVCDRFYDSTTAYQGYARGFDLDLIGAINRLATGGLRPDLTVLLDIDVETGFERIHSRRGGEHAGLDRIEREERIFHEKVRAGYLQIAAQEPDRFFVISTTRDAALVHEEIWKVVSNVRR